MHACVDESWERSGLEGCVSEDEWEAVLHGVQVSVRLAKWAPIPFVLDYLRLILSREEA